MAQVLFHITMSLDGFVAGPADDMSWLRGLPTGPNPVVERLLGELGAVVMGHNTYAPATTAEGEVYGGRVRVPVFVVTRDDPASAEPGFTFEPDLRTAVTSASSAAGNGCVAVLGPTTARRCLEAGLLDEVLVHVAPILLGDGVRLFDHPGGTQIRLQPVELSTAGGFGTFRYRVGSVVDSRA